MAIHTPKKTNKVLELFNRHCNLEFTDCSYGNDLVDSLHHEIISSATEHKFIEVYISSLKYECREYFITNQDRDELFLSKNLCEVIEYINNADFYKDEVCRNGKLLKNCNCC